MYVYNSILLTLIVFYAHGVVVVDDVRIEEDEQRERQLQQTIHTTASDASLSNKDEKCVIQ